MGCFGSLRAVKRIVVGRFGSGFGYILGPRFSIPTSNPLSRLLITSAEREVKVSRRSGMYQSYNFLTRLGMQSQ